MCKFCSDIGTTLRVLEEGTPWANKVELYIGIMEGVVGKDMCKADLPLPFWDYCLERRARIYNLTACNHFKLKGTTLHIMVMDEPGNISNLYQNRWYKWCYYCEQKADFPCNKEVLGHVLGPAHSGGNEMAK